MLHKKNEIGIKFREQQLFPKNYDLLEQKNSVHIHASQ